MYLRWGRLQQAIHTNALQGQRPRGVQICLKKHIHWGSNDICYGSKGKHINVVQSFFHRSVSATIFTGTSLIPQITQASVSNVVVRPKIHVSWFPVTGPLQIAKMS